jgi:cyclic di-GMP phosphodiesterase
MSKKLNQTELYATDLANIYKQEKAKRKEVEGAYKLLEHKNEELKQEKAQLKTYAEDFRKLYKQLQVSFSDLNDANIETIYRLSIAAEFRDNDAATHLKKVCEYSKIIAKKLGWNDEKANMIKQASPMHDIGKIGISDSILFKPGKYNNDEYEEMRKHPSIGHIILKDSNSKCLQMGDRIAYTHHEKWDGTGYPNGLAGEEIPIEGRIVALADVYDALTTKRVYKPAFTKKEALKIMTEGRGSHFDSVVFEAFMDSLNKIEEFRKTKLSISEHLNKVEAFLVINLSINFA